MFRFSRLLSSLSPSLCNQTGLELTLLPQLALSNRKRATVWYIGSMCVSVCVWGGRASARQHPQRVHISAEVTPGVLVYWKLF